MRQILAYDGVASGGARAYSLGANSYTQIGNIIGSTDTSVSNVERKSVMKGNIAQIQDTIYVLHNRTVKKKNSDGSWSTVFSLYNPFTGSDSGNRMIACVVNGVTYLVIIYFNSNTTTNAAYYSSAVYNTHTGNVVTSVSNVDIGNTGYDYRTISFADIIYFDGTVYAMTTAKSFNATMALATIGVEAGTLSVTTSNASVYGCGENNTFSLCVFNNSLWMVSTNPGTSADVKLYKFISGVPVSQYTVASITSLASSAGWKPLLFSKDNFMYVITHQNVSSTTTWRMFRCTESAATEITTPVLTGFTGQSTHARWRVICDQHSSPTNPEYILLYQNGTAAGSANIFYQFIDDSTPLRYLGSAGNGAWTTSIATPPAGGGELMYRDGEMHIEYIGTPTVSETPGNMTVYYRIYESDVFPSGYPVHVKMFCSADRTVPTTPCRLSNPQPYGSVQNSYTITGITAGSGVLYSVDWRAVADGFEAGDAVTMVASVSGVI
jgi:hypothetical protein